MAGHFLRVCLFVCFFSFDQCATYKAKKYLAHKWIASLPSSQAHRSWRHPLPRVLIPLGPLPALVSIDAQRVAQRSSSLSLFHGANF